MKIIILGAPGSGKGTQADLIKKEFNLNHISTGEIIRAEIIKKSTTGLLIKKKILNGELIKDVIIASLLENYIKNNTNFLLDGFPRTLRQAIFLSKKNIKIDYIINIITRTETIIKRLKYRLISKNNNYNILYNNPKIKNKDDKTGTKLIKRSDDKFITIETRLIDYNKNNTKIITWYNNKTSTKIIDIKSEITISQIFNLIKNNIIK